MKKILVAFAFFIYLVPVSFFWALFNVSSQGVDNLTKYAPLMVPLILMFIICALVVANIAGAIVSIKKSKYSSFRAVMGFKLCLIPFYILNFVCWGVSSTIFHVALAVWSLIPFVIAYTYFTVIGTSAYNIANLLILRRNKDISTKQCVWHCILQLTFMTDVIDSVYLTIKHKKWISSSGSQT